jgi:tetratricopeptide (TPR) repeat protein
MSAVTAATLLGRKIRMRLQCGLLLKKNSVLMSVQNDPKELRIVLSDIEDGYRALGLPPDLYLRLTSAWVLLEEERWSEARTALESIDSDDIEAPTDRSMYENNLAWAMAHGGDPEEAISIAERALAQDSGSVILTGCLWGTLGAAQTMNCQHTEAVKSLRRAIELDDTPSSQGIRNYFLGNALHELGETTEAVEAWKLACAKAPGQWRERAAGKVASSQPAYR